MRSFRSDNNAGLCPEALQAIINCNAGHEVAYSDDTHTARAVALFRELFGQDTAVYFVATGTAANTLSVAALAEPWQRTLCHVHSHMNQDESNAPERITQCRLTAVMTDADKLIVDDIKRVAAEGRGDVHQPKPGVVSITNATEFGTVYSPDEMGDICDAAHAAGYRVRIDGARFANAVASLNCDPRAISRDAGVDALCFGGTKNGLASGEAVLFFPQGDGSAFERATQSFEYHRMSFGHLISKHRYLTAPFVATLTDGTWLRHARHANNMATMLGSGLQQLGVPLKFAVQANGVFAQLPQRVDQALRAKGYGYYPFGETGWKVARLMCSFDTEPADIERFLADVESALER